MSLLRPRVRDHQGLLVEGPRCGFTHRCFIWAAVLCVLILALQAVHIVLPRLLGVSSYSAYMAGPWPRAQTIVTIALVLTIPVAFLWPARNRFVRDAIAAAKCASCGYDLSCGTTEPDGCTVCPGCGAAWRIGGDRERETE